MAGSATDYPWFDALSEGVVLVESGVVVDLNRAAAELLDVRREVVRGRSIIGVMRDHRLERLAATGVVGEELRLQLRGKVVTARALPGALLLRDDSEVNAARSDARELLAVLSHELRTPVAAIRGVLDALAGDNANNGGGAVDSGSAASDGELSGITREPQRMAYFLGRAKDEAERLTRLLSDLTIDVKPPRERTVDLAATVARAVAVTESVQQRHGVSVVVLPTTAQVWVDEDKLLQALVNLLENAAIHGPAGGTVEVASYSEGESLSVEVRDQGEPLAAQLVAELFEPKSQGGAKSKGTGLGLFIVRSLASAWGGEAWGGGRRDGVDGNAFGFTVPQVGVR